MAVAAALWLSIGCTVAPPPVDSPTVEALPEATYRVEHGTVVFDRWPPTRRAGGGENGMAAGFVDELVVEGLQQPTAVRQLPDGSFLVIEQRGVVKHVVTDGHVSPTDVLDIRTEVYNRFQLGLLGLALDPDYPAEPYLYLLYTRDAPLGGDAPTYSGKNDVEHCPERRGCPASARLVRYELGGAPLRTQGAGLVLVEDWCIAGRNHTIGTVTFGPDGALYVGGGDGADGAEPDYGQLSTPINACDDPPTGSGVAPVPPDTQGGSLRSQDLRLGADPVSLDGTIVRVDPATGEGLPDNPLADSSDANARRIIAYGLRNPFRFVFRPGTDELWIADVGFVDWEELNVVADPVPDEPYNFGWPCYEGAARQPLWDALQIDACEELYESETSLTFPEFAFERRSREEPCGTGGAAISALAFYDGGAFPERYEDALFFADQPMRCLFVMEAGADGEPDPDTAHVFASPVHAVDMIVGGDGALYYVDVIGGELRRIRWVG